MIYNTTINSPQFFNGSSWINMKDPAFDCDFLVIAGGAGSSGASPDYIISGGAGAGGYRSSYNSESSGGGASSETNFTFNTNS